MKSHTSMDSKPTGLVVVIFMLLSIQIFCPAGVAGDITGVCYGRNGNNLPTPADTVALYKSNKIDAIRMYEPFADMLEALRGSGLSVAFGPRNEEIQSLAQDPNAATNFVATWITPYKNDVDIKWITIGNEVFPGEIAPFVAAAIKNVNAALTNSGVTGISVTTVLAMNALTNSYPPSAATFLPDLTEIMTEISSILSQTNSPLMANIYPYFAYASDPSHISLDYASFKSQTPIVIDGDLKLLYLNYCVKILRNYFSYVRSIAGDLWLILSDEHGWRVNAYVDRSLVYELEGFLREGDWKILKHFDVSVDDAPSRLIDDRYKITISRRTVLSDSPAISSNLFAFFVPFQRILDGSIGTNCLIELKGKRTRFGRIKNYATGERARIGELTNIARNSYDIDGYRLVFYIEDHNGKEIRCLTMANEALKVAQTIHSKYVQDVECVLRWWKLHEFGSDGFGIQSEDDVSQILINPCHVLLASLNQ